MGAVMLHKNYAMLYYIENDFPLLKHNHQMKNKIWSILVNHIRMAANAIAVCLTRNTLR
jgi:hypothetical protein